MDVIKLMVLTWGDDVGLLEWIPSAFACFLLRQKEREILTLSHKRGSDMMAQRDVGLKTGGYGHKPRDASSHQEVERQEESLLE